MVYQSIKHNCLSVQTIIGLDMDVIILLVKLCSEASENSPQNSVYRLIYMTVNEKLFLLRATVDVIPP